MPAEDQAEQLGPIDFNPHDYIPLGEAIICWTCILVALITVCALAEAVVRRLRHPDSELISSRTRTGEFGGLLIIGLTCLLTAIQMRSSLGRMLKFKGSPNPIEVAFLLELLANRLFWIAGGIVAILAAKLIRWSVPDANPSP